MLQYYNIEQKQQLHWRNFLNLKNSLQMDKKNVLTKSLYILKLEAYEKKRKEKNRLKISFELKRVMIGN